jgi:3-hydroxybutyrate dehydrogenase
VSAFSLHVGAPERLCDLRSRASWTWIQSDIDSGFVRAEPLEQTDNPHWSHGFCCAVGRSADPSLRLPSARTEGNLAMTSIMTSAGLAPVGNPRMMEGKVAVVAGSTSGIGFGIATALAAAGAMIVLNGLGDPIEIGKLCQLLGASHDVPVRYDDADMTDAGAIRDMVERVGRSFGPVDIMVNNAGIQHVAPVEEFPPDKWDAILAINLSAAFHATRAVLPEMKRRGSGRIVNIASTHGLISSPFKSAYVAAKHGVVGLTKVVALEVAEHGVTCNAVCPGYVWTPLV